MLPWHHPEPGGELATVVKGCAITRRRHDCGGHHGALAAVWIRGITNDSFFQIGLVTRIGLSAKNAILIVEFVNKRYQAGLPVMDAAPEGATLRFRPIIMTSMAFLMGVTPLVLATGAGGRPHAERLCARS